MSLGREPLAAWLEGFPRVSGDEPHLTGRPVHEAQFSPRERG